MSEQKSDADAADELIDLEEYAKADRKRGRPVLILDDATTWPDHLTDQLNQPDVIDLMQRYEFMESVVKSPSIRPILSAVEEYASTTLIGAYHCTKQLPDRRYSSTGLRVLNFEQHHMEFRELLRKHPAVTPKLFQKIDAGLRDWEKDPGPGRKKRLWFCIDRMSVLSHGTEEFFKYYGGEAIYGNFLMDPEVLAILETIGEPVVVEFRVRKKDLKLWPDALGKTLVSYFAHSINPEFNISSTDGYIQKPIPPSDIVAVHPHKQFVKAIKPRRKK